MNNQTQQLLTIFMDILSTNSSDTGKWCMCVDAINEVEDQDIQSLYVKQFLHEHFPGCDTHCLELDKYETKYLMDDSDSDEDELAWIKHKQDVIRTYRSKKPICKGRRSMRPMC